MNVVSFLFKVSSFAFALFISRATCLHLTGTWRTSDFFLFLSRFGFQKTDPGMLDDTQGFIYGNITSHAKINSYFNLVLVDSEYFMEYYGNSSLINTAGCKKMFDKIDTIAFDSSCQKYRTQDFLRKIPCPTGKLCIDEDNPKNLQSGFQFTYKVQNIAQPRYWYLSLVACHRDSRSCKWTANTTLDFEVDYDIWLVNGDPASKHLNPFEHQFSFEMHDVFEIYLVFTVLYIIVIPVWIYAYRQQVHPITKLLTVCISTEFAGVVLNFLHVLIFSINGVGAEWLKDFGNLLGIFAECFFMLILLLIAKGWTITSMKLTSRRLLFMFWGTYTALNALFFILSLTKRDYIVNIDEWNSWPGYLIVGFRVVVMGWFFLELRGTFRHSQHQNRLDFFQQFGAYYLVWFIYLPVLVLIASQISHLWRYKTILSITYAADFLSYLVLIHLLWPTRSVLYLIKGDTPLPQYDLEAAGLVDMDDVEETIFQSPMKKPVQQNGVIVKNGTKVKKTRLAPVPEERGHKTRKDEVVVNGNGYTNINLDESDYEMV